MKFAASRHWAVLLAVGVPAMAQAQWVDFAQVDGSSDASTLVLVREAPRTAGAGPAPLLSVSATRWSSGQALAIGYVYRWTVAPGEHQWLLGAGAGANRFRSRAAGNDEDSAALSARLQSEWFGPLQGGTYYALVQVSSFRSASFATLQYNLPATAVALEVSRYHERTYQATGAGLRVGVGVPHWFVRVGAVHAQGKSRPYLGVTYNAF